MRKLETRFYRFYRFEEIIVDIFVKLSVAYFQFWIEFSILLDRGRNCSI